MNKNNKSQNKSLRLSEMLPIIRTKGNFLKKGFILPGTLTVLVVIGLFNSIGNPQLYNFLLSLYLASICYYFIYQLCGKYKPWWLSVGSMATTILLLVCGGNQLADWNGTMKNLFGNQNFLNAFLGNFFGPGLGEEFFKALPVFLALGIGRMLKSPWRERIGVWEPLDGILLATASAVGFTLLETLGVYVPSIVSTVTSKAGEGSGELLGLHLLIPRIIGSVAGHMAYSGYFGYFIGLSVLKPSKRWLILAIGYLTASTIHALWNSAGSIGSIGEWFSVLIGGLAYIFLIAAILKARQLSPTRNQNWATQYLDLNPPPPPPLQPTTVRSPFSLSIQQRIIPLPMGSQLLVKDIPGLGAQARGVVAEVNSHPQNINILGIKNCSHQVWTVTQPNGQKQRIDPGRSLKLTIGTRIDFGVVTGEIK